MLSIGDLNNLTNTTFLNSIIYISHNKLHAKLFYYTKKKVELDPPLYGALEISYIIICSCDTIQLLTREKVLWKTSIP